MSRMFKFLSDNSDKLTIVPNPTTLRPEEELLRDAKDRPILRAAIAAGADYFLTGDKDFLVLALDKPRIISANEFLEL
ncbi:MAG: hypothetical protein IJ849_01720 [Selenomonadaceae bacterium]|nr:hypothetical protein [Selenomonadaceae bacterium]